MEQTVRHLHAAAGHPTEETWLKAIKKGNYNSWPLIDTKNIRKKFPESEETQFGHMRGQRQGTRSTRKVHPAQKDSNEDQMDKKHDIFINIYKLDKGDCLTNTIYSDQTVEFPYISSWGNRSIMVILHINSNSFSLEPLKNQKV